MRRIARSLAALALIATPAAAIQSSPIDIHDLAGTNRDWQEGMAVVDAPLDQVRHWLTAYEEWPLLFPDVQWVRRLGVDRQGRDVFRFRSRYAGRAITMHQRNAPNMLVYEGWGPNVHTQGRTYLIALTPDRTRVIMQTSSEVHGLPGVFASHKLKRERADRALRGHLQALVLAASRR
jgi:hypothetical protein